MSTHAYDRMQQRFDVKLREHESIIDRFNRMACEACVRLLEVDKKPDSSGAAAICRSGYVWIFDLVSRNKPVLLTVYPPKESNIKKGDKES